MTNIKDVAKLTGLGTSTISRYFNHGYVSENNKSIIEEACIELNYTPNNMARAVKTKHTFTICLVVSDISNMFYSELSAYIQQACMDKGYKVLLLNAKNGHALEALNKEYLHSGLVDGAIITSLFQGCEDLSYSIPIVFLENLNDKKCKQSCIYVDQFDGVSQACAHLIEKGCKKICYVKGNTKYYIAQAREKAYIKYMHAKGLPSVIIGMDTLEQTRYGYVRVEQIDGVLAWNDYIAAKCIEGFRSVGIRIPEDIQLVGYDDVALANYLYPKLTTVTQPLSLLGAYAVDTLINKIEGKQKKEIRIILENTLNIRDTTK